MVLSPQDIHNKEFSVKMRGYNIDQVNDFLDQIVKDYQITIRENIDLKKSLRTARSKVKYFDNLKDSLNQSILVAQEAADKVKDSARKQSKIANDKAQKAADVITQRAKVNAKQVVKGAVSKANQLIVEATDLRKATSLFRHKLQSLLESQLEFTKSKRWNTVFSNGNNINYQKISDDISKLTHHHYNYDQVNGGQVTDDSRSNVIIYPDGTYKNM